MYDPYWDDGGLDGGDNYVAPKLKEEGGGGLPNGCTPYNPEGGLPGQMMRCGDDLFLTPDRQTQIDHGTINWLGVATDLLHIGLGGWLGAGELNAIRLVGAAVDTVTGVAKGPEPDNGRE